MTTKMSRMQKMKVATTVAGLTFVLAFFGNACSEMMSEDLASTALPTDYTKSLCGLNTEFKPIDGAETASISYGPQVFDNMRSCTGLSPVSQRVINEAASREASFSEYASVGTGSNVVDLNSAMMMSIAALAVEVCNNMIDNDASYDIGSASRGRIFKNVDFTGGSGFDDADINEVMNNMARACWSRNPTAEEVAIVQEEIGSLGNVTNAASTVRAKAIGVCTSVLASLDGIRQ